MQVCRWAPRLTFRHSGCDLLCHARRVRADMSVPRRLVNAVLKKISFENEGADDDQFAHVHVNLKNICCDLLKSKVFLGKITAGHVGQICTTLGAQLRAKGLQQHALR